MAIEIDIRIIGETTAAVVQELGTFATHLSSGLGVGVRAAATPDTPEPQTAAPTTGNGADKPATTSRKRSTAAKPEPEEKTKLDRAAIIDGLTKLFNDGDDGVKSAIKKFRDGQGAGRLHQLKDEALSAAAELLAELKLATDSPQV